METRTTIPTPSSDIRIEYSTPVFLAGSCFSGEMGAKLVDSGFAAAVNPFGTLYNPYSVAEALELMLEGSPVAAGSLEYHSGKWLSFTHDTSFSSGSEAEVLERVNRSIADGHSKLLGSKHLFLTFGTARVYFLKSSGRLVANCHKIPAAKFERELLKPADITAKWIPLIKRIRGDIPGINIVFTISPVRHWKDGAYGNQVSKASLFLAIDELMRECPEVSYFPSYEMMIDDLRDYRYYKDDMLHPSGKAVEYIWNHFKACYMSEQTAAVASKVEEVARAMRHRISDPGSEETKAFAKSILDKIARIKSLEKGARLDEATQYFSKLA